MRPTETAWLAGLLEGEGCFGLYIQRGRPVLKIQLGMNDRDVIERAAKLMGAPSIYTREAVAKGPRLRAESYHCAVSGSAAERIMESVRPFMGYRRGAKIDEVLVRWRSR